MGRFIRTSGQGFKRGMHDILAALTGPQQAQNHGHDGNPVSSRISPEKKLRVVGCEWRAGVSRFCFNRSTPPAEEGRKSDNLLGLNLSTINFLFGKAFHAKKQADCCQSACGLK
jgi:hypothetical protein